MKKTGKMTLKKETILRLQGQLALGGSDYLPDWLSADDRTSNSGNCLTCFGAGSTHQEISYTVQSP